MVLGPLLLFGGVLLRLPFHFFFPQQLAAFREHPGQIQAAYLAFAAGNVLMWPAVLTLVKLIGERRPGWAVWGGTLAMFGLFARTHSAGIDHLAFQLVRVQGLETATGAVAGSYGAYNLFPAFSLGALAGWMVLAIGAWLSRTLGLVPSLSLSFMSALMLGTLKGTSPTSVLATAGLCVALVPLGIRVLRDAPRAERRVAWVQGAGAVAVIALALILGPMG